MDALHVPAHVLLLIIRQEHDVVVHAELLRVKVNHVDTTAKGGRHDRLLIVGEIAASDRRSAILVNKDWLLHAAKIPNSNFSVRTDRHSRSEGVVHLCIVDLGAVEVECGACGTLVGVPDLDRAVDGA